MSEDLDVGDGRKALAELKRNPQLVHSRDRDYEQTPLHIAAARGHTKVVQWLVAHGADVNARCYNEFTPLLLAQNGEIARILLKAGAKTNVRDATGATPLQSAAEDARNRQKGRMQVVFAIRAAGVPLDLETALILDKRSLARQIAKAKPEQLRSADVRYNSFLHLAVRNGDIETAKLLLSLGAEIDGGLEPGMNFGRGRYTALCAAIWHDKPDMVAFLCSQGANPRLLGDQLTHAMESASPRIKAVLKKYSHP